MSGSQQTFPLSTIFPIYPATNPGPTLAYTTTSSIRSVESRKLLVSRPAFGCHLRTQPQRDVFRLHRLFDYPDQLVAEGAQICLVT
jgi:hypothetical protein